MNRDAIDVHALNRAFDHFDQVEKKQTYQLAESDAAEHFDEETQIQTCDMRDFFEGGDIGKQRFAQSLGSALEDIGFAILTGHGINLDLYSRAREDVKTFFESTSRDERLAYRAERFGSVNQGYFPKRTTSNIHPDLVEGWVFCRRAFNFQNNPDYRAETFWPRPALEPRFRNYVEHHEPLFLPIMQSMLRYLGCDPHLYDKKLTATNFGLRLNYYPPMSEADVASGAGRILGHEDMDLFTLLAAPDVEGLQVLNRRNFRWVRLNAPAGSIILNTGDYMQRISNDRLPSTTHRVSKPRDPALLGRERISYPIAVYVWENEVLDVLPGLGEPKYEPVRAIQFHTRGTSKFYGEDYAVDG